MSSDNPRFEEIPFDDDVAFDEETDVASAADVTAAPTADERTGLSVLRFAHEPAAETEPGILWPVLGWRVAAPTRRERTLDFLQLTILRLSQAGFLDLSKQAAHLALDKDLVAVIRSQLYRDGLVDRFSRVTEKGRGVLAADGVDEDDLVAYGWVFQDAIAGEVLPWFQAGDLRFFRKDDDITQATRIAHPSGVSRAPASEEFAAALQSYRSLAPVGGSVEPSDGDRSAAFHESTQTTDPQPQVGRGHKQDVPAQSFTVRLLTKRPRHFHVLVRAALDPGDSGDFRLHCPFGLPDGLRWVRLLHFAEARGHRKAVEVITRLREASRATWEQMRPPGVDSIEIERVTRDEVERKLGPMPDVRWEPVWRALSDMERSLFLMRDGVTESDSLINRAQKALEHLTFLWLDCGPAPTTFPHFATAKDGSDRLKDTALACGAHPNLIPTQIVNFHEKGIKKVLLNGNRKQSLRLYATSLLYAAGESGSEHERTLRAALTKHPGLLDEIDQIAQLRNTYGSHADTGTSAVPFSSSWVDRVVYQIVGLALEALKPARRSTHR